MKFDDHVKYDMIIIIKTYEMDCGGGAVTNKEGWVI